MRSALGLYEGVFYLLYVNQNNELKTTYSGVILKDPAVQVIAEEGIFVRFGEFEALVHQAELDVSSMLKSNMKVPVQTVISLSRLPVDLACYVIRRMIEHPGDGFIKSMYEKQDSGDFLDWIINERQKYPINVFEWYRKGGNLK